VHPHAAIIHEMDLHGSLSTLSLLRTMLLQKLKMHGFDVSNRKGCRNVHVIRFFKNYLLYTPIRSGFMLLATDCRSY